MNFFEPFAIITLALVVSTACAPRKFTESVSDENSVNKGQTLEQKLISAGLHKVGAGIEVDLAYTKEDPSGKINFLNKNMYGDLRSCYLRPEVAKKLLAAQLLLKEKLGKNATLVMYDCARPLSVQKAMWAKKPDANWVANPYEKGSKHNYGASVDLTFRLPDGKLADMGSRFDDFSEISVYSAAGVSATGKINRKILRDVMVGDVVGERFYPYNGEWWHFDGHPSPRESLPMLNF